MAQVHQLHVIIMIYCRMLHDAKCEQGINLWDNHVLRWMTSMQDYFHVALLYTKIMFFTFSQAKNVLPQSPNQKYIMTLEEILSFATKKFMTTSFN